MPGILDRVNAQRRGQTQAVERKQFSEPSFWQLDAFRQALVGDSAADRERIENDFIGYAAGAGKANGIVFACCYARLRVFADGNFLWRKREDGQLSAFYDSPELAMLRRPWPGGTLTNLLSWMEVDATYAGNSFSTTCDDRGRFGNASRGGPNRRITRLRPDWVTLVIGSHSDDPYAIDARVVGLIYEPPLSRFGGAHGKPVVLMPDEVCHYAPVPDPVARFRGMSWLTPVLREVSSDLAATDHKLKRWENGAALQTVVSLDKDISPDAFKQFVAMFRTTHEGVENAYKTLFLGGGADVNVVGADMQKMDFKNADRCRRDPYRGRRRRASGRRRTVRVAGRFVAERGQLQRGTPQRLRRHAQPSVVRGGQLAGVAVRPARRQRRAVHRQARHRLRPGGRQGHRRDPVDQGHRAEDAARRRLGA
jgi:hypothetical protein